jgi:RNA polymerase sigma-70 factor (ECF subfamily)
VTRLQLREEGAIEELILTYSGRLRRIVRSIVRNSSDADDIVQKSLWKAYQSMRQYRGAAALSTWLVSIARNESFALIRARKVEFVSLDEAVLRDGLSQTPEQVAMHAEIVNLCLDCVSHLRPRTRAIMIMRLMEDQSHEGIADHLKISVNAVKVRYHRGFKKLCGLINRRLAQGSRCSLAR